MSLIEPSDPNAQRHMALWSRPSDMAEHIHRRGVAHLAKQTRQFVRCLGTGYQVSGRI